MAFEPEAVIGKAPPAETIARIAGGLTQGAAIGTRRAHAGMVGDLQDRFRQHLRALSHHGLHPSREIDDIAFDARGRGNAPIGFDERKERATPVRSEEHTSELQSLMRISYAVFCLKKKK